MAKYNKRFNDQRNLKTVFKKAKRRGKKPERYDTPFVFIPKLSPAAYALFAVCLLPQLVSTLSTSDIPGCVNPGTDEMKKFCEILRNDPERAKEILRNHIEAEKVKNQFEEANKDREGLFK